MKSGLFYMQQALLSIACLCLFAVLCHAQDDIKAVLTGTRLASGFDIGVDSSSQQRDWLQGKKTDEFFTLAFPSNQVWAAVFVTADAPKKRRTRDFSEFKTLSVEMKGAAGGEKVEVGIKSLDQADDGSEVKLTVTLTKDWKTYQFSLDRFKDAKLKELFVVAEFVSTCPRAQTVHLRSVKYFKQATTAPETGDAPCTSTQAEAGDILTGAKLVSGYGMGVDSSEHRRDWLERKEKEGELKMAFPADQQWCAVFVTVGPPKPPGKRQSKDFSSFKTLAIEMRGAEGGEVVEVGIKTDSQDDDGTEHKIPIRLSSEWKTYSFPLEEFKREGTDPKRLYVVAEFVYDGAKPQTVFFKNIKYLKAAAK